MPSAMSSVREPVDTTSTSRVAAWSPRRITEPLPNCFSIWPSAAARAFLRLSSIAGTFNTVAFIWMIPCPLFHSPAGAEGVRREREVFTAGLAGDGVHQRKVFRVPGERTEAAERAGAMHLARQGHVRDEGFGIGLEARAHEPLAQASGERGRGGRDAAGAAPQHLRFLPVTVAVEFEAEGIGLHRGGDALHQRQGFRGD